MERQGSRSQKGPYSRKEGRKSFISKMTDSFKDIIYPSWLSRGDKNDTPESATTSKATDPPQTTTPTSSGLVGVSNPDLRPFQSQSMGIPNGLPRTMDYPGPQPPNLPPPISEFTSSLLPLNRLTEKSDSVLANEDTMSQRSDASKSTSGCSSMVPQLDSGRRDTGVEKRKANAQESPVSQSPPSPGPQPTAKRQRINVTLGSANRTWTQRFNETLNSQQAAGNLKRPAFNTSLFGTPLNEDSSVLGTSFHQSSFYPGKTMYGGRSSFRSTPGQKRNKIDLNQSLPSRLSFPVKSFAKAKPRDRPVKEAVTSSTAKRILDVLERMPTPLGDAKKIPVNVSHNWTEAPSFFSREVASTSAGPPTRRLTMGSMASISQNRQTSTGPRPVRQDNSLMTQRTSSPSVFTAVGLQREDTVKLGSDQPQASGKMKRDKSYHRGSASIRPSLQEDDTVIMPPALRTDFTLPVSATPQFNFTTPSNRQAASSSPSKHSDASLKPTALNFTFSSPIVEKSPSNKMAPAKQGFQFSSPISLDKKGESSQSSSTGNGGKSTSGFGSSCSTPTMQMNFSTAPKPKASFNGPSLTDSNEGGFKPANVLKTGSVMDILGGSSSSKPAGKSLSSSSPAPLSDVFKQSGWNCDVCLVTNKEDSSKCVACQTPKPGPRQQNVSSKDPISKGSNNAPPLSALFKQSGWACDVCMISNKDDTDKCLACQTPRPGPKKQIGPSSLSKNGVLPGNWICNTCLIQNKAEDSLCGACKSSKSASAPKAVSKQDDLLAKLKPSTGQWECELCLIQNKSDTTTCVACQSAKPQKRFKHPAGDWECDTCLVNNKEKDVKCVACSYPRPGPPRTQVVPSCAKSYSMSQPSGFSLPDKASIELSKDTSNVISAGGFKFGTATTSSNNGGFKFGANSEPSSKTSENGLTFGSDSSKTVPSSGFKFGMENSSNSESSKSDNVISTGGFNFGTTNHASDDKLTSGDKSDKKDDKKNNEVSTGTSGFQFGSASSNNSLVAPVTGGFKFGVTASTDSSSSNTSTGGFQFGVSTAANNTLAGGFQFGTDSVTSSSISNVKSVSVVSNSSVISSPALVNSSSDPVKTSAIPGGFTLPSSGSLSSVTPLNKTSIEPSSQGVGGFNFTSNSLKDTNSTTVTSSPFAVTFGGAKTSEASLNKDLQKPVLGGISDKPAVMTSTPAFGGFNFAQNKNEGLSSGTSLTNSSDKTSTKRGRDEDSGEAVAKKGNFTFGSSTTSTPFQFGAVKNDAQPNASPFVFGQQNSTPTTIAQAGGFNFNTNKSSDTTSKPLFGGAVSATQTTSAAPAFAQTNSVFGFSGQASDTANNSANANSNLFKFGGASTQTAPPPAVPATFNFGATNNNSFGATSGNVFGGNAASTTPAFGVTPPPAFGSTNTGAVSMPGGKLKSCPMISSHLPLSIHSLYIPPVSVHPCSVSASKQLNSACVTANQEEKIDVLDLLTSPEGNNKTCRIEHQTNKMTLPDRKINSNIKFKDCESQTDRNKIITMNSEAQTDKLQQEDTGSQTDFKTLMGEGLNVLNEGSQIVISDHVADLDRNRDVGLSFGALPSVLAMTSSMNSFKSSYTFSKFRLCSNTPIYCEAKGKGPCLIPVSATKLTSSNYSNVVCVAASTSAGIPLSTCTTDLLPEKQKAGSFNPSLSQVITTSSSPDSLFLPTNSYIGNSCIRSGSKSFNAVQCSNELKTAAIISLYSNCSSVTSSVLTYSQSCTSQSVSMCTKGFRKPEDSQMDIEVSPMVKLLKTTRILMTEQTAGPSGLHKLPAATDNKLMSSVSTSTVGSNASSLPSNQCESHHHEGKQADQSNIIKGDFLKHAEIKEQPKANMQLQPQLFFPCTSTDEVSVVSSSLGTGVVENTVKSIGGISKALQTTSNVCFEISQPLGIIDRQKQMQTAKCSENKDTSKSILKKETNEMVSAFNSTAMFDTNDLRRFSQTVHNSWKPNNDVISIPDTSSIFGGGRYFHTKSSQPTSELDNQCFSRSPLFNNVDKGKCYFSLGKSDLPDAIQSNEGEKPRKGHNLWTRLKLSKKVDRVEVQPMTDGSDRSSPSMSRAFAFTPSVEKPTQIAIVSPVESTNVFKFTGSSDICLNHTRRNEINMVQETVSQDEPSSSGVFTFSGSSSNKKESMSQGGPSSSGVFTFSGSSSNKKESMSQGGPSSSGLLTFSGSSSNKKESMSLGGPSSSGVFTFSGSSSNKKESMSLGGPSSSGVFTFSGSSSNKKESMSQGGPSSSGVFTFSGSSSNKKESMSLGGPSSSGVFTFSGSSSNKKESMSLGGPSSSGVFTFSGSSSNKKESLSQGGSSSSGVFTFSGSSSSNSGSQEEYSFNSPRSTISDSSQSDFSSSSDTSLSSDDEDSSSSDSDSSDTSRSSSSSSSSTSSSMSDEDGESNRMECSSDVIERSNLEERNNLSSDGASSGPSDLSQNSCPSSESTECLHENPVASSFFSLSSLKGVFQFGGDKPSSTQQPTPQTNNTLFQFGGKPVEPAQQPAPANTGFNFNNAPQAGLGGGGGVPNFNFAQTPAPGAFAFSASPNMFSAQGTGTSDRKIKKAVRKIKR